MGTVAIVGTFVGGIGLFLLGMRLMTDGLRVAAGSALRRILERSTQTRVRALVAGLCITSAVQSSSAVTVAAIGFVNAGLLELPRAVWVVFGSNVGTTITGWIVAVSGLDVNIEAMALPLVGLGTVLKVTGPEQRRGALGEALAGFGLFFLGIGFLESAFGELAEGADVAGFGPGGVGGAVVYVLVGLVLTTLTQSSSAALAVTLTAASQGVLDLPMAGAMVVGANLGTTSTAVLATIDATPNAKRTAAAHVAFNLITAVVALALLPWLLSTIAWSLEASGFPAATATSLAIFHTVFNVLGVLLMIPISGRLVASLKRRFRTKEEEEGTPRHLDDTVLAVPAVALEAIRLEHQRLGHLAARLLSAALADRPVSPAALSRRRASFDSLLAAISDYVRRLDRRKLPTEVAEGLERVVHASQHYLIAVDQAADVAEHRAEAEGHTATRAMGGVLEAARDVVRVTDPGARSYYVGEGQRLYGALEERYKTVQAEHIRAAAAGELEARDVAYWQNVMAEIRRGAKHLARAAEIAG